MPGASSQRMLGCVALKVNQLDLHFQEINESITGRDREAHDGDVVADAVLFAGMERSDVGVFSSMSHGLRHDKALKLKLEEQYRIKDLKEHRRVFFAEQNSHLGQVTDQRAPFGREEYRIILALDVGFPPATMCTSTYTPFKTNNGDNYPSAGPREDSPTDTIWKTLVVDSHSRIGTRSTQVENEIKFDIKCIKHALHEE
ncbi:hypothetical protein T310_9668 [Rasamsonia emersonii CBS 393.64]|uniref:Uncharacterized protein n=1 Tax=Rasamsonia emersonii (strain ATCC 16479 / CBS 393.64 / IMI 116815) TaxID=1408163 RepID=A0A0F4YF03_RASE3|nr:hypothetical protein T310_9668 [Rasamsonia emersonii CBS 393.64]KKA16714.1 hypothetical protein T310_9668 [Rasamsonia emersonii CBS 393.64]